MASNDTSSTSHKKREGEVGIFLLTEQDIPGAVRCIQQAFGDGDPYFDWAFDKRSFSKARNSQSLRARCLWGIDNAIFLVAKKASASSTTTTISDPHTNTHDGSDPPRTTPAAAPPPPTNSESDNGTGANDDILGVAMWLPPRKAGTAQSWAEWWAGWVLWARQVRYNARYGRGGLNVRRYYIWKSAQTSSHSALWTDPDGYYFCNIVAVLPAYQGRGVGARLLRHVLDRADAEQRPCYLESSRDVPNTAIYERFGFRGVRVMVCRDEEGSEGGDAGGVDECKLYCMIRDPKPRS